ncbi:MAG: trigger factor, partial [Oscillospiraceae bacterium]|jgi:trigger factor|nr:trigger factor [Oscillospiraceae bacterium]
MREQNARIVAVENRAAQTGDTAVIDFEGFIDGVPFAGGKGESHSLELGSGSFIPGFEDQIAGHSSGDEFDVTVTFPEEYHAEEMSGKAAVFKVKLCEIKERQLPEADDEFARDVSEFDTLDELKADVRRRQEESKTRRSDDEMETKLIDTVVEGVKGDIPEVMFEHRIDEMVQDFDYRLRSQGMNIDIYLQYTGMDKAQFRESFRNQAERQVKIRLALEKISVLEGFELPEEEIEKQYEELSKTYSRDVAEIKRIFSEKDIREDLLCKKASDLIRESAKVTEVPEEKAPANEEEPAGEDANAPEGISVAEAGEEKPKKKPAAKKAPAKKKAEEDGEA